MQSAQTVLRHNHPHSRPIYFSMLSWVVQGKTLTNSVKQIFTDFQAAAEKFQKLSYDAMNVDATQFAHDFAVFCGVMRELERRLGAVIAQVHMQLLLRKLVSAVA